jgi:hypothetical protein
MAALATLAAMTVRRWWGVVVLGVAAVGACGSSGNGSGAIGTPSTASTPSTVSTAPPTPKASGSTTTGRTAGVLPSSVDTCTLLADADVANAFVMADPRMATTTFKVSRKMSTFSDSPDGVACEYHWATGDGGAGSFVVEVVPGDYFDLVTGQPGAVPVAALAGAKRTQGGDYAKVRGLTLGVLNVNTAAAAGFLIKASATNMG